MYTDTIADLLTRIRNANMAKKEFIPVPHSKMKVEILEVLKKKNYVQDIKIEGDLKKQIIITMNPEKEINSITRVSKPGQRIYIKAGEIKKVHGGLGLTIMSTPKGVMSNEDAKKANLGGEIICEVF